MAKSQASYCQIGRDLVKDVHRSSQVPPYNGPLLQEEGVRRVVEEIKTLNTHVEDYVQLQQQMKREGAQGVDSALVAGMVAQHTSALRNKRLVLAYLGARARRIEQFRWEYGSVLLDTWRSKLSTSEVDYFKGYNDALNTYMRKVGIDLTADTAPPKHLDISVRVLDDVGEIMTAGGEALRLRKHDVVRMRRVDAEQLIRQGKAKQLDS